MNDVSWKNVVVFTPSRLPTFVGFQTGCCYCNPWDLKLAPVRKFCCPLMPEIETILTSENEEEASKI